MAAMDLQRTILVVDDNQLNREKVCEIFSPHYRTVQVTNGAEALDYLREHYHDVSLVVTDLTMPVMDGKQLLSAVAANDVLSFVPIVVITDEESEKLEAECLALGAADFLKKPINPIVAINRVRSIIRLRESDANLSAVELDPATGLYTYQAFLLHAETYAKDHLDVPLTAVISQLSHFDHFDEVYGKAIVAEYLKTTGEFFGAMGDKGVAGYFGQGRFGTLTETMPGSNPEWLVATGREMISHSVIPGAHIKYGVYEYVDRHLSMRETFHETAAALQRVLDDYTEDVAVYDSHLAAERKRRYDLTLSASKSIDDGDFYLMYQPKHDVRTGDLVGCEALVRWNHPNLGFVSPGEFIPLFERNGLVRALDRFVRQRVVEDMRGWQSQGLSLVPVSVNFSKRDLLDASCVDAVIRLYAHDDELPIDLFHIEVTETMWSDNPDVVTDHLQKLHGAGFGLELDDFGTGYSSLNLLTAAPLDVMKLDMSLIRDLDRQMPIVRHSIELAHELGMTALAEGVEDRRQVEQLNDLGLDVIQGYYYSKPLLSADFAEYLRRFS